DVLFFRLAERKHVIILRICALCSDESTLKLFVSEALQTYTSLLHGKKTQDSEDVLQYIDVIAWQNDLLASETAMEQQQILRTLHPSEVASIPLPFERKGRLTQLWPESVSFSPQQVPVVLEAEWQCSSNELSQLYEVSQEAFVLTCWQILLWRLTGANSPIGVTCDGRPFEELATV